METVVHCAGISKRDEELTRTLVSAAQRAGVRHLLHVSVVGADLVPARSRFDRAVFGYYHAKAAAERVIESSGVPWTTLRATQFHDLILMFARYLAKLPVMPVPAGLSFQPVDADEVAERVVELALGPPAGRAPDVAGPRVYAFTELVRSYLRAAGLRRVVLPVPLPGAAARAYRAGANLAPDRAVGRRTWEEFLEERVRGRG